MEMEEKIEDILIAAYPTRKIKEFPVKIPYVGMRVNKENSNREIIGIFPGTAREVGVVPYYAPVIEIIKITYLEHWTNFTWDRATLRKGFHSLPIDNFNEYSIQTHLTKDDILKEFKEKLKSL